MKKTCMLVLAMVLVLAGCGPKPPVRIGFMGGLTDRGSDVGEGGRNGLMLAVEQRNQSGGIQGRQIELVVQDDGQNPAQAATAIQSLVDARVDAIVGPFTSAMAAVAVPVVTQARVVTVSPTVTGADFVGKDDFLFRINASVGDNGSTYAKAMYQRGIRNVAAVYDLRNRSFTETWLKAYTDAFVALGGKVVTTVPFESHKDPVFGDLIRQAATAKPDSLLFIATAVDTARLAQQARKMDTKIPLVTAEWAASESLLELGGQAVEGMLVLQAYNKEDTSERFRNFLEAYQKRFQRPPGYSAVNAYDAATVLLDAMARKSGDDDLKTALIQRGPFEGLQQPIRFDKNGDTNRVMFFTEIRSGRFVPLR
jgi:branched-chain amino acid transport system substrate-binding protein